MSIRRMLKKMFCKHTHKWKFYPADVWCDLPIGKTVKCNHGLEITVCWQCGKFLEVRNYAA